MTLYSFTSDHGSIHVFDSMTAAVLMAIRLGIDDVEINLTTGATGETE